MGSSVFVDVEGVSVIVCCLLIWCIFWGVYVGFKCMLVLIVEFILAVGEFVRY